MTDDVDEPMETETNASQTPVRLEDTADATALLETCDLVLLEFVTDGCGICASMEPVLGSVARSAPGTVGILNAGHALDLAEEFDVRRVPTLVVVKDGEEVDRLDDGFQPAETLVELLETHT
ncbi:thioredoxin family protein [Natrarchaeobius sp. A-rgal3]|uniref:thioredoxin family protein n=1 Tax=Natrarchaeobius versutus TaxID=1679078 RepID=UPI003510C3DA